MGASPAQTSRLRERRDADGSTGPTVEFGRRRTDPRRPLAPPSRPPAESAKPAHRRRPHRARGRRGLAGLKATDAIDLDKSGMFTKVTVCYITTLYYTGFSLMMQKR